MRTKTEARREAILAAAQAVFEEVGFEQATMSEITARLGGSKATLYRYFDSKEALFQELLRRSAKEHGSVFTLLDQIAPSPEAEASEVLAQLGTDSDVTRSLQKLGEQILKTFHTPQRLAARRLVIAAATDSDVGKTFYQNGPAKALKQVERYFTEAMENGQLRNANARVVTAHFRALVEAEIGEEGLLNVRPQLDDEEISLVVARAVDVFMRAYGAGSESKASQ